jgi:hypothetical protein
MKNLKKIWQLNMALHKEVVNPTKILVEYYSSVEREAGKEQREAGVDGTPLRPIDTSHVGSA